MPTNHTKWKEGRTIAPATPESWASGSTAGRDLIKPGVKQAPVAKRQWQKDWGQEDDEWGIAFSCLHIFVNQTGESIESENISGHLPD